MKTIFTYFFEILSVLSFLLVSIFYYAFSGGTHTEEFVTGVFLLLISFFTLIALFLSKKYPDMAGKIFIATGISALVIIGVRIGNPVSLFFESLVGAILTGAALSFVWVGMNILGKDELS